MAGQSAAVPGCVLLTGASGGIGRQLAEVFAANGWRLVLSARSTDRLRALARELTAKHGTKATILPADLADPASPQAIFDALRAREVEVDILVNNAGLLLEGELADAPLADQLGLLQVNIVALTALTRLFLDPMLARGSGRILNVASTAAFVPIPRLAAYAASKAYVLSLTEALSEELKGTGVTVTALCPGFTDTDMVQHSQLGRRLPSLVVMDAKSVAEQGYAACLAGKPVHVAGLGNDLAVSSVGYLPRWVVRTVGGLVARNTA